MKRRSPRWLWVTAPLWLMGCEPELVFEGPATLEIGTGEFSFEPIEDRQHLPIVSGTQGGHHVWLGIRATELDPREVRVDTRVFFGESENSAGSPLFFYARMFDGPSGDLEYAGLLLQMNRTRVREMNIRVEVTVTDRGGRTASDAVMIVPTEEDIEE